MRRFGLYAAVTSHCMSVGCLGGAFDASSASASDIGLD